MDKIAIVALGSPDWNKQSLPELVLTRFFLLAAQATML
jgi:hypothetical protein